MLNPLISFRELEGKEDLEFQKIEKSSESLKNIDTALVKNDKEALARKKEELARRKEELVKRKEELAKKKEEFVKSEKEELARKKEEFVRRKEKENIIKAFYERKKFIKNSSIDEENLSNNDLDYNEEEDDYEEKNDRNGYSKRKITKYMGYDGNSTLVQKELRKKPFDIIGLSSRFEYYGILQHALCVKFFDYGVNLRNEYFHFLIGLRVEKSLPILFDIQLEYEELIEDGFLELFKYGMNGEFNNIHSGVQLEMHSFLPIFYGIQEKKKVNNIEKYKNCMIELNKGGSRDPFGEKKIFNYGLARLVLWKMGIGDNLLNLVIEGNNNELVKSEMVECNNSQFSAYNFLDCDNDSFDCEEHYLSSVQIDGEGEDSKNGINSKEKQEIIKFYIRGITSYGLPHYDLEIEISLESKEEKAERMKEMMRKRAFYLKMFVDYGFIEEDFLGNKYDFVGGRRKNKPGGGRKGDYSDSEIARIDKTHKLGLRKSKSPFDFDLFEGLYDAVDPYEKYFDEIDNIPGKKKTFENGINELLNQEQENNE